MDSIIKTLRGLRLGKSNKSHAPEKPPRRTNEAHAAKDTSKEADELLRILAANLISYALRKYLSSAHNKKRIASGGVEIDHVILQAIGEKVLEKVLQAVCAAAQAPEKQERSTSAERRRKRRIQDERRRPGRRHSRSRSLSAERRRRERRHRQDRNSPRRESHANNPSITITPPDDHPPKAPEATGPEAKGTDAPSSSSSHRSSRRRVTRADCAQNMVPLDDLREGLEELSARLIELSAKAALPEGRTAQEDCDFYEKFVEKSGPVQDVIGEVLGKIREIEEGEAAHGKGKGKASSR
ncbi:hypothetical protein F5X68DRAFT_249014 [Plectosphaerella plurivora]|uniref:Uncharacterized protein n=1 Tax=Plectosphaerella plurivora TaxID=936078 RepID=A0A9P8V3E5_9PEZI|nr:hypothetical protein F5X68DRAFT_249014 [Plectosphaerella plurivora]